MFIVNVSGVCAQGTVHENRHPWQLSRTGQFVQDIDNLLCASNRERGNDDLACLFQGLTDQFAHQIVRVGTLFVNSRGIGGLNLEIVHVFDRYGISQQFIAATADVTGKQVSEFSAAFLDVQNHLC